MIEPHVTIKPAPAYFDFRGAPELARTDVLIVWRGQHFASRYNYVIADTPANRIAEAEAFMRRRREDLTR